MKNDYLWDGSGPADPEVAALEELLGRFRSRALDWTAPVQCAPVAARRRPPLSFLTAAAVLIVSCAAALVRPLAVTPPSWAVVRLEGAPTAGLIPISDAARLRVGQWLETDARSRATVEVSTIGRLDVEPGTRLRMLESRVGAHRLAMAHGLVHAFIWAPPGQFVIDTPSSRAVDLGCAYTLEVGSDGSGVIEVSAGWVAFEHGGRESFIPAGARCATRPRTGPGTPYMSDAPKALSDALSVLDFGRRSPASDATALAAVLAHARPDDAVTLWHLLGRVSADERDAVFEALARFVPPPRGVTRDGIRRGDRTMRDVWWNALDLGDVAWWRTWQRHWP
jgi:hypothetical protein